MNLGHSLWTCNAHVVFENPTNDFGVWTPFECWVTSPCLFQITVWPLTPAGGKNSGISELCWRCSKHTRDTYREHQISRVKSKLQQQSKWAEEESLVWGSKREMEGKIKGKIQMRMTLDHDFVKSLKGQFHKATADWETRAEEDQAGDFCS